MFNRQLRTRFDLLRPNRSRVVEAKTGKTESVANGRKTRVFYVNQSVLIRDYRYQGKWIEGTVVKQLSTTLYKVRIGSGILFGGGMLISLLQLTLMSVNRLVNF